MIFIIVIANNNIPRGRFARMRAVDRKQLTRYQRMMALWRCYTLILLEMSCRTRWWCLKCVIVYLARDIPPFVMYCVYGESGSSLLIESTDCDEKQTQVVPSFTDVCPNGSKSLIDLALLADVSQLLNCSTIPPLSSSDHLGVSLSVKWGTCQKDTHTNPWRI